MRRLAKLAPLPPPMPAVAVQDDPLVQAMLTPPVPVTAVALKVSTTPKASGVDVIVQLAFTVALTGRFVLLLSAWAGLAKAATAVATAIAVLMRRKLRTGFHSCQVWSEWLSTPSIAACTAWAVKELLALFGKSAATMDSSRAVRATIRWRATPVRP
jgi:hypothetical protein